MRWIAAVSVVLVAGCPPTSGPLPGGPDPNAPVPTGGDPGGGAVAAPTAGGVCPVANFTPSPGLEGCFDCMMERCCAEVQACDRDPDCVYCTSAEGQIDSSARCVDQATFQVHPNRRAYADCQTNQCVTTCGATGHNCTPSSCSRSCPDYATGCR